MVLVSSFVINPNPHFTIEPNGPVVATPSRPFSDVQATVRYEGVRPTSARLTVEQKGIDEKWDGQTPVDEWARALTVADPGQVLDAELNVQTMNSMHIEPFDNNNVSTFVLQDDGTITSVRMTVGAFARFYLMTGSLTDGTEIVREIANTDTTQGFVEGYSSNLASDFGAFTSAQMSWRFVSQRSLVLTIHMLNNSTLIMRRVVFMDVVNGTCVQISSAAAGQSTTTVHPVLRHNVAKPKWCVVGAPDAMVGGYRLLVVPIDSDGLPVIDDIDMKGIIDGNPPSETHFYVDDSSENRADHRFFIRTNTNQVYHGTLASLRQSAVMPSHFPRFGSMCVPVPGGVHIGRVDSLHFFTDEEMTDDVFTDTEYTEWPQVLTDFTDQVISDRHPESVDLVLERYTSIEYGDVIAQTADYAVFLLSLSMYGYDDDNDDDIYDEFFSCTLLYRFADGTWSHPQMVDSHPFGEEVVLPDGVMNRLSVNSNGVVCFNDLSTYHYLLYPRDIVIRQGFLLEEAEAEEEEEHEEEEEEEHEEEEEEETDEVSASASASPVSTSSDGMSKAALAAIIIVAVLVVGALAVAGVRAVRSRRAKL